MELGREGTRLEVDFEVQGLPDLDGKIHFFAEFDSESADARAVECKVVSEVCGSEASAEDLRRMCWSDSLWVGQGTYHQNPPWIIISLAW